jgi:hypothetical protein
MIAKYALKVIQIQKPNFKSLGKNWVDRFLTEHTNNISMKWSAPLPTVHAKAVNETTSK